MVRLSLKTAFFLGLIALIAFAGGMVEAASWNDDDEVVLQYVFEIQEYGECL